MGHVGDKALPVLFVGINKVRHPPHGHGKIGKLPCVRHLGLHGKITVRIAFRRLGDFRHRLHDMPGVEVKDDCRQNRHTQQTDHQYKKQLLGKVGKLIRRIHQRQIGSVLLIFIVQGKMLNIAGAQLLGQPRKLIDLKGGLSPDRFHQRGVEPDGAIRKIRPQQTLPFFVKEVTGYIVGQGIVGKLGADLIGIHCVIPAEVQPGIRNHQVRHIGCLLLLFVLISAVRPEQHDTAQQCGKEKRGNGAQVEVPGKNALFHPIDRLHDKRGPHGVPPERKGTPHNACRMPLCGITLVFLVSFKFVAYAPDGLQLPFV